MKRSEMIKILEDVFSKYESPSNIAERALSACENAGMCPPPDPTTDFNGGQMCQWEYDGENHE